MYRTRTVSVMLVCGLLLPAAAFTRAYVALDAARPAVAMPERAALPWRNASWLNADSPVTLESLRGRVVLLNFWVFTCGNCQRTIPSLKTFDAAFRAKGLTIIGIHTPEFPPYAGEHSKRNVQEAIERYGIRYPVAQDNDNATWNLYQIRYWPSLVLIDKRGMIRFEDYGEFHVGDDHHKEWERRIAALLAE